MSTHHVRRPNESRVVLAVSDLYHYEGKNKGRVCQFCEKRWTIQIDGKGDVHVWRNGVAMDKAILDWTGNNAVVECCQDGG